MARVKRKITIVQHRLLHYRVPFFEKLKALLEENQIAVRLIHGQASPAERMKKDEGYIEWATRVNNTYFHVAGKDICWQPLPPEAQENDLTIIMQENRILSNYPLLMKRRFGGPLLAYWGHGRNFQSSAESGLRERWKQFLVTKVDWWFAYTDLTVDILRRAGYPVERITCLNNAMDTNNFKIDVANVSLERVSEIRDDLNISPDGPVGLYCGSLYPEKNLEFLVHAADMIQREIPGFHLIVVGNGPSAGQLQNLFHSRPWAHWVGVKKGKDKAAYYRLAKVVLNPGLVGLHILDAFCAGLPLFTTASAKHSPEIAYLGSGKNGFIIEGGVEQYARSVISLLRDEDQYHSVSTACSKASEHYTVENMAANFAQGIQKCLESNC